MTLIKTLSVAMIGTEHAHASGVMCELRQYENDIYYPGSSKLFNVVCYVDNNPTTKEHFENLKYLAYEEFDQTWQTLGLDALIIETEMDDLLTVADKYLEMCGLPIHMDKPTGYDEKFIDLMKKAESKDVPVSLGYMYRFNPAVIETRKILREDADNRGKKLPEQIGKVFQINCNMNFDGGDNTRKDMEKYPGGGLYVYGSHMLDLVYYFLGPPSDIHVIKKSADILVSNGCDNGLVVLEYANGTGIININLAAGNGYNQRSIVLYGDQGCIEIHPMEVGEENGADPSDIMQISTRYGADPKKAQADYKTSEKVNLSSYHFDRRYLYMMKNFAYLVNKDTKNILFDCDYEYEESLHELLLKIIKEEK